LKLINKILYRFDYKFYKSIKIISRLPIFSRHPSLIHNYISPIKGFLSRVIKDILRPEIAASIMVCFLVMPVVILSMESIQKSYKNNGYPYHEGSQGWMDMGKWLRENVPSNSITMTRNPWELHFYSEQPAIQIPRSSLDKIIEVMRYYHPSHIIPQLDIRPSLEPLVKGRVPGFELVYDNKDLQLYKIRYDLLPEPGK
jgi:hypothetical protein